ncbi:hypothetical protein [Niabella drilacis]|uniref:Uncharacterized protein n=1 Tax=Niabella drilacis (strain DSM 25811 / CCM 8410 / CCUG 62505 / LMG 26954 / E90) TaxID=1285928 RepID=A0A1G6IPX2_NIADE|nr:hypothetical protein [Niabella drilacis]SDC08549.1 hypothetical protein SAMN04487894_101295 [Niabella drilacis]
MLKKRLLQTATLLLFVCGIVLFLAYRSGNFTDLLSWERTSLQSSPNGGSLNTSKPNGKDSIRIKKTTMSSSKSVVLVNYKSSGKDSAHQYYKPTKSMLSSSKSAIIFKPADSAKKIR